MKRIFVLVLAVAILSGCATREFVMKNVSPDTVATAKLNASKDEDKLDMLIEPYQSLGLKLTPAIKSRNVTVIQGVFPDILFGEFFPGRIRWNGWVVDKDGREYSAQILLTNLDFSGYWLETIIIDGKPSPEARVAPFSTGVTHLYDLAGNETEIVRGSFLENEKGYRKKTVMENGTRLGDMKIVPERDFYDIISKWNAYTDKATNGVILSPIGKKELRAIAGINPRYSFSEKLVASGHFSLVADPYGTVMGLAIDVIRTSKVTSTGWDFNSEIPNRRQMAYIIRFVSEMKNQLIKQINDANVKLVKNQGGKR